MKTARSPLHIGYPSVLIPNGLWKGIVSTNHKYTQLNCEHEILHASFFRISKHTTV